jgi:hypothetical protein
VAFPSLNTAFGLPSVMLMLTGLAVLAVFFVARFLPETKTLSVEEVVDVFERQSGASTR